MRTSPRREFLSKLFDWFQRHERRFPWREGISPWEAVLTAFLLRKTRAETVARHYGRITGALSSPSAVVELGVESLEELLKPLGMHKIRAKQLHELSLRLVKEYGGSLPEGEELRELPGFGDYTIALISYFSRGKLVPIADVNVERVLGRVFGARGSDEVRRLAAELVRECMNGRINLAIMDFAAEVCRAKNPRCRGCPLAGICEYHPTRR